MIKITDLRDSEEVEFLPKLPFFTMDDHGRLLYYIENDDGNVVAVDIEDGEFLWQYSSLEEAMSRLDQDEKIVDVEIIVKSKK